MESMINRQGCPSLCQSMTSGMHARYMEVQTHTFSTLALNEGEPSALHPSSFTPQERGMGHPTAYLDMDMKQ
jgi:hypothetical protein